MGSPHSGSSSISQSGKFLEDLAHLSISDLNQSSVIFHFPYGGVAGDWTLAAGLLHRLQGVANSGASCDQLVVMGPLSKRGFPL